MSDNNNNPPRIFYNFTTEEIIKSVTRYPFQTEEDLGEGLVVCLGIYYNEDERRYVSCEEEEE